MIPDVPPTGKKNDPHLRQTLKEGARDVLQAAIQTNNKSNPTPPGSSLDMNQTFNSHSIVHIVLSCATLPLAVYNLYEQNKHIQALKAKRLPEQPLKKKTPSTQLGARELPYPSAKLGVSEFFTETVRTPTEINNNLIFIKKAQMASTATNIVLSLIVTGVVISAIFTGGLSLGAIAVTTMALTSIKIGIDIYLAKKETNLKNEFFESKVLSAIPNLEPKERNLYERLVTIEDRTAIMASIALNQNKTNPTLYPEAEIKEYVLTKRQGLLENAKLRNIQLGFAALGAGIWSATNYLSLGLPGIILSAGATGLSVVLSIIKTQYVQNALGSKTTEWFRTFFSKKNGTLDLSDYKNKEINSFIEDIKNRALSESLDSYIKIQQGISSAHNQQQQRPKTFDPTQTRNSKLPIGATEYPIRDPELPIGATEHPISASEYSIGATEDSIRTPEHSIGASESSVYVFRP